MAVNGWMAVVFKCELVNFQFWTLIMANTGSCHELETFGLSHLFLSYTVPVSLTLETVFDTQLLVHFTLAVISARECPSFLKTMIFILSSKLSLL